MVHSDNLEKGNMYIFLHHSASMCLVTDECCVTDSPNSARYGAVAQDSSSKTIRLAKAGPGTAVETSSIEIVELGAGASTTIYGTQVWS